MVAPAGGYAIALRTFSSTGCQADRRATARRMRRTTSSSVGYGYRRAGASGNGISSMR